MSRPDELKSFTRQFEFVQEILDQRFNNFLWEFTELFTLKGTKMRAACKYLSEFTSDIINKEVIQQLREEVLQDIKRNLRMEVMSSFIDNNFNNNSNNGK